MTAINWKSGINGDWSTAADWAGGKVPGAADDVTIAAAGSYTVTIYYTERANSLTLNAANAKVVDSGQLTLGTTLSVAAGTFTLSGGGDIVGGTISTSGSGSFLSTGGTLSGVTYQGALTLGASSSLFLQGSNAFVGAGGTGAGTINMSGTNANLFVEDKTTLDNATLTIGAANANDTIYLYSQDSNNPTLTLGSHFNLVQSGTGNRTTINLYNYVNNSSSFVNQGTITADAKNGVLSIYGPNGGNFINQGLIAVSNGDTVSLQTNISNTSLGSFTTATGGVLQLSSGYTLSNAGATLSLGGGSQLTLAGTVAGGTVSDTGGGLISQSGTLSGVTYQGTLAIGAGAVLNVTGGLNVSTGGGTGIINDTGASAFLDLYDTQTLDNATLNFGANTSGAYLYVESDTGQPATLTLGSHLALNQTGKYAQIDIDPQGYGGNVLVNQGTITAAASGGTFSVYGEYAGDSFSNQGLIAVSNTDYVQLNTNVSSLGSFTTATGGVLALSSGYTLSNAGATLALGAGSHLTLSGTIAGGTVSDSGGGLVSSGGTLSGVIYQGTLTIGANVALSVVGGLNVSSGIINVTGSNSQLYLYDTQTLDNATLNLGNTTCLSGNSLSRLSHL